MKKISTNIKVNFPQIKIEKIREKLKEDEVLYPFFCKTVGVYISPNGDVERLAYIPTKFSRWVRNIFFRDVFITII